MALMVVTLAMIVDVTAIAVTVTIVISGIVLFVAVVLSRIRVATQLLQGLRVTTHNLHQHPHNGADNLEDHTLHIGLRAAAHAEQRGHRIGSRL